MNSNIYTTYFYAALLSTFSLAPSANTTRSSSSRTSRISSPSLCLRFQSRGKVDHSAGSTSTPANTHNMFLIRVTHDCLNTAVRVIRACMGLYLLLEPHLHRRVFVVRSGACGQFDGCDPKTPDVCFEVVTFHLHTNSHKFVKTREMHPYGSSY